MTKHSITVSTPIDAKSFRVSQVAGLFDVPIQERASETFEVEVPELSEKWQIGLIVGPSGSGKTTIARHAYGNNVYEPGRDWPEKKSVLDGFADELPAKELTALLSAVGFSSPPSWIKPYGVLSNGEKFRCDLARSLTPRRKGAEPQSRKENLVVFDEFTSVVDRTVAKVGSMAVSKLLRQAANGSTRFIAVTCHYDVAPWLSPDWILDMASGTLARRRLRRPDLHLEIFRTGRAAWELFKKHHYLSHSIPGGAQIFGGYLSGLQDDDGMMGSGDNGQEKSPHLLISSSPHPALPVGIVIVGQHFGNSRQGATEQGIKQISRIVVLPDYQGIGIGSRLLDGVAGILRAENWRVAITTSHPGMIAHLARSPAWKVTACDAVSGKRWTVGKAVRTGKRKAGQIRSSLGRTRVSALFDSSPT